MITPLTPLNAIVFTTIFLGLLFICGDVIRRFLCKLLKRCLFHGIEVFPANIAFGSIGLPIIILILTPLQALTTFNVRGIAIFFLIFFLGLLKPWRNVNAPLFQSTYSRVRTILPFAIFFLGLILRIIPTIGALAGPLDDVKMHTLLTNTIIDAKGFPSQWGLYAPIGYETATIRYPLVFHSISAFFTVLTKLPSSQVLFLITQIYNALIPFSLFLLVAKLFDYKSAVFSAFILSVVSAVPLLNLGGNAEIFGIFLAFFVATFIIDSQLNKRIDFLVCLFLSLFLLKSHLYAFILLNLLITIHYGWLTLNDRKSKRFLQLLLCMGLVIGLDFFSDSQRYFPRSSKESYLLFDLYAYHLVSSWNWDGFGPFIEKFGFYFILLFLLSIGFLRNLNRHQLFFGCFWVLIPLFMVVNSLYDFPVRFPFWYLFHPERMFFQLVYPLTLLCATSLSRIWSRNKVKHIPRFLAEIDVHRTIFLIFIGLIAFQSTMVHHKLLVHSRKNTLVQPEDIVGFEWIRQNVDEDAIVFTSWSDGGGFLPVFARRRGVPTMYNIYEDWMNEDYFKETGWELNGYMTTNPNHPRVYKLLDKYQITHVYCGQQALEGRPPMIPQLLIESSHYEIIYHLENSNVYIFKVLG